MFNVDHGDCVLIIDDISQGLLVDCGSKEPRIYLKIPQLIENLLLLPDKCGFVVSHCYWDHYGLSCALTNARAFLID